MPKGHETPRDILNNSKYGKLFRMIGEDYRDVQYGLICAVERTSVAQIAREMAEDREKRKWESLSESLQREYLKRAKNQHHEVSVAKKFMERPDHYMQSPHID